ncbi:MAG: hypothetical protein ACYDIC_03410 [Desulfobaccales bacterium]
MLSSVWGSVGLGLMCGWLVGSLEGRVRRPWRTAPVIVLATLALATPAAWFQGGLGLIGFGVATLTAGLLHLIWKHELRRHYSLKT